jgi:pilus assembly protein TadC
MTIVGIFIAFLSLLIACLALAFTIGSFWWLNVRQGRLKPGSTDAVIG